jgi:nucleoside-diphosphate-sugar epimerase
MSTRFPTKLNRSAPMNDAEIDELLSTPTLAVVDCVRRLPGAFMVLGVGGKMGGTTALMLRRALNLAGRTDAKIIGVSRFGQGALRSSLEAAGVGTIACDLADEPAVAALPETPNVLFLAGQKFGTDVSPGSTWLQNVVVPALVARKFRRSRIVVFSTGCVYPFVPVSGNGSSEADPLAFQGEYASTCVGRERVFAHFSQQFGTPQLMFRLNYSVELRYGVLADIAVRVARDEAVDLNTGWLNISAV